MRPEEFPKSDLEREAANYALAETARDSVDRICTAVIDGSFVVLQAKVLEDAKQLEQLDEHEQSDLPEDEQDEERAVSIFVSPTLALSPMYHDDPQEALTLLLERKPQSLHQVDQTHIGEKLRLILPIPRPDYHYPEPLEDEDKPTEMYVEFITDDSEDSLPERYIIQRSDLDPQARYSMYPYESAYDTGEQTIHDALSDRAIEEGVANRIPTSVEQASRLLSDIGNFEVIHQKTISLGD